MCCCCHKKNRTSNSDNFYKDVLIISLSAQIKLVAHSKTDADKENKKGKLNKLETKILEIKQI